MFALDREDVWPVGDLALSHAVKLLLEMKERPRGSEFIKISEKWRPRRTAAAILLWHFYHNVT